MRTLTLCCGGLANPWVEPEVKVEVDLVASHSSHVQPTWYHTSAQRNILAEDKKHAHNSARRRHIPVHVYAGILYLAEVEPVAIYPLSLLQEHKDSEHEQGLQLLRYL